MFRRNHFKRVPDPYWIVWLVRAHVCVHTLFRVVTHKYDELFTFLIMFSIFQFNITENWLENVREHVGRHRLLWMNSLNYFL